ncbi:glycosyltransferase family 4 protein [bacterium]|nr:glycosyltransferase family 4 protein [bacterium]MBU1072560.1 glycosyltransferase family 4 protein [bacterium]MBU1675182.1 glycosyltransferase family 4 protein [bacterium]
MDRKPPGNVCFVNGMDGYAGAEIWMLDTARGLRDRGWRVSLVAPPGSRLLEGARAEGIDAHGVAIRFDAAPWTFARLWEILTRHGVRAVLCNRLKDLKAAGVAARLAGIPVVLQSRESDFPLRRRFYYRWYYNGVATGVLVNSRATRDTTLRSAPWLDPARVHLLYKGVDRRHFFPTPMPAASPLVVGFVGSLDERKGVPLLMEAWTKLVARSSGPRPVLRIAGSGPLRETLLSWQMALPHPGSVELLGWVDDMPELYRTLDLLVCPSRYEGFGLAAVEAMACGRPVVATRASSLPEIVEDGVTGLLSPPADADALQDALAVMLGDRDARERMGQAAVMRVEQLFDREVMLDRLEDLLRPPRNIRRRPLLKEG